MNPQIVGGWVIFVVGILVVVVSLVAVAIKVLVLALAQANAIQTTAAPGGLQIIIALMKSPYGLAFVLGVLAIHLGLVMLGGGSFLGLPFLSFSDPTH